jgi:hypothetical protein
MTAQEYADLQREGIARIRAMIHDPEAAGEIRAAALLAPPANQEAFDRHVNKRGLFTGLSRLRRDWTE